MQTRERIAALAGLAVAAGIWFATNGCGSTGTAAQAGNEPSAPSHSVASGSRIRVALTTEVSSETAHVGDTWHGRLTEEVSIKNGGTIPPGSHAEGVVAAVTPAGRGSRAMLDLGVRSVQVNGRQRRIPADAEPVIAGSSRARNLGAIAGGAAAGALVGKVVGDGRNATAGGAIGGAAAAGVVAGSKGYQVVLKDGTVLDFTVSRTVAVR